MVKEKGKKGALKSRGETSPVRRKKKKEDQECIFIKRSVYRHQILFDPLTFREGFATERDLVHFIELRGEKKREHLAWGGLFGKGGTGVLNKTQPYGMKARGHSHRMGEGRGIGGDSLSKDEYQTLV